MKSRLARIAATLALVSFLTGCAPIDSIFPLFKPEDAVFDDRLLGSWQPVITDSNDSDKDVRLIFSHSECNNFYNFKWTEVGAKGGFVAKIRLMRLGNNLFADFEGNMDSPDDSKPPDGPIPFPVIATHMIGRIWLEKDTLLIRFLDDDWVKTQVKAGTFSLAHLDVNGGQILTAQTEDLRKFMQAHADDNEALSDQFKFIRAK
jgi:hypothetical protein